MLNFKILTIFILFFINYFINCQTNLIENSISYTAAVAGHTVIESNGNSFNFQQNVNLYNEHAQNAKKKQAQMIIYPEFGLTGTQIFQATNNRQQLATDFCETINFNLNEPICTQEIQLISPNLHQLACIAKNNSILVVVNFCDKKSCSSSNDKDCPKDGQFLYNTDIVFSENGNFITKYHKTHPYPGEPYDPAESDQPLIYFTSSFDVTFGLFICFDIAFIHPAVDLVRLGITHFPYVAAQSAAGPKIVSTWTSLHSNTTALFSNLGSRFSGFFTNGISLPYTTVPLSSSQSHDQTYIATLQYSKN
eukprot:TRINITY_DN4313_c5_g2_i1.p1 TRINITY_DN4313_c5_g2~~TRINITY_DN4313_c5_g2_i1.p1  ORF type:complete len:307 (+),score=143.16 TRINITY_DN4313_c5_g2_i1:32-952(+)